MRLIVKYETGDGCTYSCTETVPIEYESKEAAIIDFDKICKGKCSPCGEFFFAGKSFTNYDFYIKGKYYAPEILMLDEWYKQ